MTTEDEMQVFYGLLLLAGVDHAKNANIFELWSETDGRPIFNRSMPRDRFIALRQCIRFDDKSTRADRQSRDKFAPLREIFNDIVMKFRSAYNPSEYLTVDEQLVTFRGRCSFKMFIPSKPGKYGLKVWALTDSTNAYCLNLQPYIGRQGPRSETGQGNRVVLELTDYLSGSGRHVTADNFFTSVILAQSLLGRKITYTGTIKKNKPEIPLDMQPSSHRPVLSSAFGFTRDMSLVSYVPKKNKAVILLSTLHIDNCNVSPEPHCKPEIILDYNRWKGGVDTLDQLVRHYSCKRKTSRWPFALFCNLLDIMAYNAMVLFLHIHPQYLGNLPHRRRIFLRELSKSMLPVQLGPAMPPVPVPQERGTKRCRCHLCPRHQDKKYPEQCALCNKYVCKNHRILKCLNCV
jgi:hypothetical protein